MVLETKQARSDEAVQDAATDKTAAAAASAAPAAKKHKKEEKYTENEEAPVSQPSMPPRKPYKREEILFDNDATKLDEMLVLDESKSSTQHVGAQNVLANWGNSAKALNDWACDATNAAKLTLFCNKRE